MQFLFPSLTLGFLLVLLPLLIQLINLMRQRRVKWAAMDFLLQSYRKHRKWVWLKQFLLLMLRMLAIAAAVAMLAHLVTRSQLPGFLGGRMLANTLGDLAWGKLHKAVVVSEVRQ